MTDWVEIYGPLRVRPGPATWSREERHWGDETILLEEKGILEGAVAFAVLDRVRQPGIFESHGVRCNPDWPGLEVVGVPASPESLAQVLINFAEAQPE